MNVYLLRTSVAHDAHLAPPEAQRYLSADGRQLVRRVGTKLNGSLPDVDRVVTASGPASVQTAELFAERIDFIGVVEILSSLTAGVPASIAGKALLERGENVVVVADEPVLSSLGAFLVSRATFPPPMHAQLSAIEGGRAAWYLRPDTLDRLPLLVA